MSVILPPRGNFFAIRNRSCPKVKTIMVVPECPDKRIFGQVLLENKSATSDLATHRGFGNGHESHDPLEDKERNVGG
jgi:hypothetical protein